MVRTQIQFTERQADALKQIAARRRVSVAAVVRNAVDDAIGTPEAALDPAARQRALAVIGSFADTQHDVSTRHDDYLAQAIAE